MIKILVGNIVKCSHCGAYLTYEDSDIKTEERSYGVGTYGDETYWAKVITCPKCNNKNELY